MACKQAESALAGKGRLLIRPSGTEPLLRIMVESPDMQTSQHQAALLSDALK